MLGIVRIIESEECTSEAEAMFIHCKINDIREWHNRREEKKKCSTIIPLNSPSPLPPQLTLLTYSLYSTWIILFEKKSVYVGNTHSGFLSSFESA
jgi:hypothetical protein